MFVVPKRASTPPLRRALPGAEGVAVEEGFPYPHRVEEAASRTSGRVLRSTIRGRCRGFHNAARKQGVRTLLGAEVTAAEDGFHYPLLVENRHGYQNLCRLLTRLELGGRPGATPDNLAEPAEGVVLLAGDTLAAQEHRWSAAEALLNREVGSGAAGGRGDGGRGRFPLSAACRKPIPAADASSWGDRRAEHAEGRRAGARACHQALLDLGLPGGGR